MQTIGSCFWMGDWGFMYVNKGTNSSLDNNTVFNVLRFYSVLKEFNEEYIRVSFKFC